MKRLTSLYPYILTSLLLTSSLLDSCSHQAEPVKIHRFEQFLFANPDDHSSAADFDSPLLNYHPEDAEYMAYLHSFVSDPDIQYIYHKTDSLYHDLSWLEQDLGNAMCRAHDLCPDIVYNHYYTLLTADFESYDTRVFCYDRDLAISIDRYALPSMKERNFFMMPAYLVNLSTREHILADCMAAVAMDHIALPEDDLTLLDYAIYRGKILYFLDQVIPDVHDSIKIRYTSAQLDWMKDNIENVWGAFIQKQLLFSTDKGELHNLIGEGPKTNAFGDGSAPRVCDYLGWQIVKKYMSETGTSLADLFADTDSRKILNQSQWRPAH